MPGMQSPSQDFCSSDPHLGQVSAVQNISTSLENSWSTTGLEILRPLNSDLDTEGSPPNP